MSSPMQQWAEDALRRGHTVFPCGKSSKRPITSHGFKEASNDPQVVAAWWKEHPDANPAIACGASGIAVLDCDKGLNSLEEFEAWRKRNNLPETYAVRTGRRTSFGVQMYFAGVMPDSKWSLDGCSGEIKSAGGYVMAAGCVHPETGFQYEIISDTPLAVLPEAIKALGRKAAPAIVQQPTTDRKIPRGEWHGHLVSEAGRLWNRNYSEEGIYETLQTFAKDHFEKPAPLDLNSLRQIAHSATTFQKTMAQPLHGKDNLPIIELDETPIKDDPLPEFPRLQGPLDSLCNAITPDLAYEHKALGLLCYLGVALSGRVTLATEPFTMPRFYGISIGPPNFGKTAVDNEIQLALGSTLENEFGVAMVDNMESGQVLVEYAAENARIILVPDELSLLFSKCRDPKGGGNSLMGEILKLHGKTKTSRRVIDRKQKGSQFKETIAAGVHFGIFAGCTVANFEDLWMSLGGGKTGLQSRFVMSYSEQAMPPLKTPNNQAEIDKAVAVLLNNIRPYMPGTADDPNQLQANSAFGFLIEAQNSISQWFTFTEDAGAPRVLDNAKRFALLNAVCNGESEVSDTCMELGLKFADYQIALIKRLMPPDSASFVQAFENKILKVFQRLGRATEPQCMSSIQPERYPGGYSAYNAAFRALVAAGKLLKVGTSRKGQTVHAISD